MNTQQIEHFWAEAAPHLTTVPAHLHGGLERWVRNGQLPGDFLRAVLRNDLTQAVTRADEESLAGLHALVLWLYNHAPGQCWGSVEKMKAWQHAAIERAEGLTSG